MSASITQVTYSCDWTKQDGDTCRTTDMFGGRNHSDAAREGGWGWYENAYIRRTRWEAGARLWFCPLHATQFRNNHGWGGLESYGPPKHWWLSVFTSSKN
jgi:hypothetical protein